MLKITSETDIRNCLAARLSLLRGKKGWTQRELAERSQVPRTYLADMEGGRRNPRIGTVLRVANALGVPLYQLFKDN